LLDLLEASLVLHENLLIFASFCFTYFRLALVLRTGGLLPAGLPEDLPGLDDFPPGFPPLRLALLFD
jgi:hypothetical protein